MSKKESWKVTIETRGQAGSVNYREGSNSAKFNWEFGAHDIIAFVWGPLPENWDNAYPWAIGRRREIMHRIADEVIKQRAAICWADFEYKRTNIKIRKQSTEQ